MAGLPAPSQREEPKDFISDIGPLYTSVQRIQITRAAQLRGDLNTFINNITASREGVCFYFPIHMFILCIYIICLLLCLFMFIYLYICLLYYIYKINSR